MIGNPLVGKGSETVDLLGTYLSHLHPTVSVGGEAPLSVRFDYGLKMSSVSLSAVLDMTERIAAARLKKPIVVAFDEFQEIQRLSPDLPLEGIFRGCIQEHQFVRYLFFGSKTHMLRRMFGDRESPFYKSASTMRLDKPPVAESADFVRRRFASRSIDGLIDENADYYCERLSALSASQRMLLSALSRESAREFTADYRQRHSLAGSSSVHTALKVLVEGGIVESADGEYSVGDPFFARYVRALPYVAN